MQNITEKHQAKLLFIRHFGFVTSEVDQAAKCVSWRNCGCL